jgi:predicted PurR-regulated permease PerM
VSEQKENQIKEATETATNIALEASWTQTRAILRVIFIILLVLAIMWMLYTLEAVILLVVLSIFFAYLIAPLVEFVRRPIKLGARERIMPRGIAIGVVYIILFGSLGITGYILLPRLGNQITELAKQAPTYLLTARDRSQSLNNLYQRYQVPYALRSAINNTLERAFQNTGNYVQEGLVPTLVDWITHLPWLILIPIMAFFLLKDADSFRRSALDMLPRGRWRWRGDEFFQDVNTTLAAYIRAQLIACLLIGVVCTIGFMLIGVPYALVLGVVAGLLEFIPLAGPLAVAILAIVLSSFHSSNTAISVGLFLTVLRIVHDYVTYPRIVGQGIHLHPLAVILAILGGAELAGVAGIFLAIPAVAVVSVSYKHWLEHKGSEGLVADLLQPVEKAITTPPSQDQITSTEQSSNIEEQSTPTPTPSRS